MVGPQRATAEQQRTPRPIQRPGGGPEAVRVWLLGGFRVSVGLRSIEEGEWRLKKAAGLIKLLALAPEHRMHRDQVTELLWPELEPETALNNLHQALHVARRTLEPAAPAASNTTSRYLHLRDEWLVLCPEGQLWVDVAAFKRAATTARHALDSAAYRAAIDLYAGELLPQNRYEPWAEERRAELRGVYLSLLVELAGLYEQREEFGAAIEALQRMMVEESSQEEAHTGLMRLYALSGRRYEALLQYEALRETLSRELDAEPGAEAQRLYESIRTGVFPAAPSPISAGSPPEESADPSRHNLPAFLTSFVGREQEILEVKRTLSMTRLLTLTGAGGTGKTRLALEVARSLVSTYSDGVWLVELAPLSDPALVPQAVAAALDVHEQPGRSVTQTLSNYLQSRRTLLVVDNCEHLVDAAAHLVDALLRSCPELRVLVTSREPLDVPGEVVWQVPPLSLPNGLQEPTVEGLMRYEAVRLFVDRARSRLPDFELKGENVGAVTRVCRKLDGIPLAIELATARMGALAVEQVAQRLDDSLGLLTGGGRTVERRHRTLRATLDWSHELMSEAERTLFGRLAIFAGGWTLEAAEAVCSGNGIEQDEVLDTLSKLVDKSLVVTDASASPGAGGGALRYRMLEPVRQYAREKLEESGEIESVRKHHGRYFLALAERVEPKLYRARPASWLELLRTEHGNLRVALSWALDAEEESEERAEIGLRMAASLGRFWDAHGPGEGRRWLEKGLARSGASPFSLRAKVLNEAGFIAVYEGDAEGMALLEESLAMYKELGDKSGVAFSMSSLGHAVVQLDNRERMLSLREEAQALLSEPLKRWERAHLLVFLGLASGTELDFVTMRAQVEEALALFRELEDIRGIATCLPILGYVALAQEDPKRAAAMFEEGLLLQRELKQKTHIFMCLNGMSAVAALRGEPTRAAKLVGASRVLWEAIGLSLESSSWEHFDEKGALAAARAGLGEEEFNAAYSEGWAMTPEQAIEYALSKGEGWKPPALLDVEQQPTDVPTERLTRREKEVAMLVGRGLTNRRIADTLAISEKTVENHVGKILKKLGFSSRSQIAAWVAQR